MFITELFTEAEDLNELSQQKIRQALLKSLQQQKDDVAHGDLVGAVKKGRQFTRVRSKMKQRENPSAQVNEDNTAYHRVSVTVSDPNHPAVTQRKEQVQKTIRVKGDEASAVQKAIAFYKKKGFRVHDANYIEGYDIASNVDEASMTKSVPGKKESVFNKGVEKLIGQQVAVVTHEYPDMVAYGTFKRIGETGLCHIKLNGGKLKGWAAGDMIAVAPDELYAPWDSRLQGMTAVHREYDNQGNKTVREADSNNKSDLNSQIEFHQLGLANAQYKGPMATYHRKALRKLFALQKRLDDLIDSGEGYTGGTKEERDKRFDKFVGEDKWAKLPSGDYRNTDTGRSYAKKGGGSDNGGNSSYMTPEYMLDYYQKRLAQIEASPFKRSKEVAQIQRKIAKLSSSRSVQETDSPGISKGDETKFHKKLDTLVHNTFGKRKEE